MINYVFRDIKRYISEYGLLYFDTLDKKKVYLLITIVNHFCYRITAISIVYSVHSDAIFECKDGRLLKAYYIGVLVLLSVTALLCASIVYVSMQGTIMITSPRKKLSKLLYLKIIITLPEIVWNILGTYWSFLQSSNCQEFVVRTVQGAVITGWVLGVIVMIGIAIVFDPLGKVHKKHDSSCSDLQSDEKSQILEGAMTAAKQAWEKRCGYESILSNIINLQNGSKS